MIVSPSNALTRERVVKVADSLPCAPRVLQQLQELLADTNSDIEQVTALLRRDGALTAKIIRIANGVIYSRGEPVGSLEDALGRVGFREVYRLTSTASMLQLAELPLRFYPITPKAMRENSLLCALVMEELAGEVGLEARTAYTAGLLRSVGRIVLDVTAQKDLRYVRPPPIGPDGFVPWEQALFGLTAGEAAAAVLKAWRFQADVFVAIRDQFLYNMTFEALPMAKLLHVAIEATDAAGYGLEGGRCYVEQNGYKTREELQLSEDRVVSATERALLKFERMKAVLG